MKCRHCASELRHVFVDLATAPPSNAYLSEADLRKPEKYYPLRVLGCASCWLVQTEDYTSAVELFQDDYAYFSSTSSTWLQHARFSHQPHSAAAKCLDCHAQAGGKLPAGASGKNWRTINR